MRTTLASLIVATFAFATVACEGDKSPTAVMKDAGNKVADAAKDAGAKVSDAAKDAGNKMADAAKDTAGKGTEAAKDAMASVADKAGATDWATKAVDTAKTQLASLKEKAKNAPAAVKPQVDALLGQIDTQINALSAKAAEFKTATPETWKKLLDEAKPMVDKIKELAGQVSAKLSG